MGSGYNTFVCLIRESHYMPDTIVESRNHQLNSFM
jgi:hypothetical protein